MTDSWLTLVTADVAGRAEVTYEDLRLIQHRAWLEGCLAGKQAREHAIPTLHAPVSPYGQQVRRV